MVQIVIDIYIEAIWKLEKIGKSGNASNGYRQDFDFCLKKAIDEFIKKYEEVIDKND